MREEIATFAAGCFWGVEEAFRKLPGVISTAVGYTGGRRADPTYEDVCTGRTGHAEAVRVDFDPTQISYDTLLDIFWSSHNPTTLNRQGPDVGSQYRSAIFYHSPDQQKAAEESKAKRQSSVPKPIVTEIVEGSEFYFAEDYHQQYIAKRGGGSCHV